MNKIVLMGRLTADPETKATPNGTSVTAFSIAVDRRFAAAGQEKQTDFIPCIAWRSTADFIGKYFTKGSAICIDGALQTRKYIDKEGNNRTAFEVVVDNAEFAGSKATSAEPAELPVRQPRPEAIQHLKRERSRQVEQYEDLPF